MTFDEMYREFIKDASYHRWIFKDSVHTIEQCLQFLHDSGAILWFKDTKPLSELIFYKRELILNCLRAIFQPILTNEVEYKDVFQEYTVSKSDFLSQAQLFMNIGQISESLLKCLWMDLKIKRVGLQKILELFQKLELCYVMDDSEVPGKESGSEGMPVPSFSLRFPYVAMNTPPAIAKGVDLASVWPSQIPFKECQFSLVYAFNRHLPLGLFQRLSVKTQQHFTSNESHRKDAKDTIYIEGSGVQLLIHRKHSALQPRIEFLLRTLVKKSYHSYNPSTSSG